MAAFNYNLLFLNPNNSLFMNIQTLDNKKNESEHQK